MTIPAQDPRWKTAAAAAEMDALANDVKAAATNLKGLVRRAGVLQGNSKSGWAEASRVSRSS
jgi:hypothetical protein